MYQYIHFTFYEQKLIDYNKSLHGQNPLEIGKQSWNNMRLVSMDLSGLGITQIPEEICDLVNLEVLNLTVIWGNTNYVTGEIPACLGNLQIPYCFR